MRKQVGLGIELLLGDRALRGGPSVELHEVLRTLRLRRNDARTNVLMEGLHRGIEIAVKGADMDLGCLSGLTRFEDTKGRRTCQADLDVGACVAQWATRWLEVVEQIVRPVSRPRQIHDEQLSCDLVAQKHIGAPNPE